MYCTERVQPICLPFDTNNVPVLNNMESQNYKSPNAWVAGWGSIDGKNNTKIVNIYRS
jgi:hypothetical protein